MMAGRQPAETPQGVAGSRRKGVFEMVVSICLTGEPKEIAALALELQGQQREKDFADAVMDRIQEKVDQSEPVFQP